MFEDEASLDWVIRRASEGHSPHRNWLPDFPSRGRSGIHGYALHWSFSEQMMVGRVSLARMLIVARHSTLDLTLVNNCKHLLTHKIYVFIYNFLDFNYLQFP